MSSGIAPDSICPRGWMMATYSGDKSYNNLIDIIYGGGNTGNDRDTTLLFLPSSFIRSGSYDPLGDKNNRGISGSYWESRISRITDANRLGHFSTLLSTQTALERNYGVSLRCVSRS